MAHTIYVGKIAKRKNSTLQPSLTTTFDVLLKSPTSLHTPTFTISAASFDYNYIKWGDRYYFVTDVVSKNNNLWEVSAICDVLATYKADIIASTQFVSYSSHKTSDWLADTRIALQKNTQTSVNTALTGILSTIGCYVLNVVGKNGCATYYSQNESDITSLLANISSWQNNGINNAIALISNNRGTDVNAVDFQVQSDDFIGLGNAITSTLRGCMDALTATFANVQNTLSQSLNTMGKAAVETGFISNAYLNAPSCIRSCIWVPFDYARANPGTGSSPIWLGNYSTGVSMAATNSKPVTDTTTINIPWHYSDWRRAVCEDVYLYLPLVGMVPISGDSLTHRTSLSIDWSVTYTDGVICYKVKSGSEVIGTFSGQCAANYPIGIAQQASAGEVFQSVVGGIRSMINSGVSSSISPISAVASVAGIAAEGAIASYDSIYTEKSTHISCVGSVGGGAGIGLGRDIVCYTVSHPTVVNPADMVATMGYPTMKPLSLSTLTGFCQCANAHVAATGAESQELNEIDAYLNGGFYIE